MAWSNSGNIRGPVGATGAAGTTTWAGITDKPDVSINGTAATHTAQQVELGHASDTTLSRASAGRLAVEGVNVVTTSSTDTLTNKTISGASNTLSNVPTSALSVNNSSRAYVATSQSTTSTSFTDLATTTDSVTVTIGASGLALVSISSGASTANSSTTAYVGFAISGANTSSASAEYSLAFPTAYSQSGATFLLTGLTSGSTTFKMKYLSDSGSSATFQRRQIAVVPL